MAFETDIVCIFKALSDENRIRILKLLHSEEKCACRLLEELDITQPTLSHHMKLLCSSGLVKGRKEGKWMYYKIDCDGVRTARMLMQSLLAPENIPADCGCKEG